MSAITEAHYNGVYYKDIKWSQAIHKFTTDYCPCCGVDGAELIGMGHQSGCEYILMTMDKYDSPRLRIFVQKEIKEALEREGRA